MHEKSQKIIGVNPDQTIKKLKNPITSVKSETRKFSYICEKNLSSKLFIVPYNLLLLIIVVAICSIKTLFQSSFLY